MSQGIIDLARSKHPGLTLFRQAAEELRLPQYEVRGESGGFDSIVMVNVSESTMTTERRREELPEQWSALRKTEVVLRIALATAFGVK